MMTERYDNLFRLLGQPHFRIFEKHPQKYGFVAKIGELYIKRYAQDTKNIRLRTYNSLQRI